MAAEPIGRYWFSSFLTKGWRSDGWTDKPMDEPTDRRMVQWLDQRQTFRRTHLWRCEDASRKVSYEIKMIIVLNNVFLRIKKTGIGKSNDVVALEPRRRLFLFFLSPIMGLFFMSYRLACSIRSEAMTRLERFLKFVTDYKYECSASKAHKANDASSWWRNDCMMTWLFVIVLDLL